MEIIALGQVARSAGFIAGVAGFLYGCACVLLFLAQRSMIYQPPRGAPGADDTQRLLVADAELRISVRPHAGTKALIYFGGNAEEVELSLPGFAAAFPDRALFLLHYRGYGGSTGKPTEAALHNDAVGLFDRVHSNYSDIAVVGRSLGSGVAIRLASARPASSLVLVTPFFSIQELAARKFPFMPISWLLIDKFESWRYAPLVHAPTLLLVAGNDELIPASSAERLYRAFAPGVASLKVLRGFDHNDISSSAVYLDEIRAATTATAATADSLRSLEKHL